MIVSCFFVCFFPVFFGVGGFSAFRLLWLFISHPLHSQFLSVCLCRLFASVAFASSAAAGGFLASWLLAAFSVGF